MAKKKKKVENNQINEKYSISELLEDNEIKPLYAVGFLEYYDLTEDFKKEFETKTKLIEFTEEEFNEMYMNYMKREI